MIRCYICGREETDGVCLWCEEDRRQGEAFAATHGIPWSETMSPEAEQGLRDIEPILQFFGFSHLREDLAKISEPFHDMAFHIVETLPRNPERTVALRKLLEAKDCSVRAFLYK